MKSDISKRRISQIRNSRSQRSLQATNIGTSTRREVLGRAVGLVTLTGIMVEFFSYAIAQSYFGTFHLDPSQVGISPINAASRMLPLAPSLFVATLFMLNLITVYRAFQAAADLAAKQLRHLDRFIVQVQEGENQLQQSRQNVQEIRKRMKRMIAEYRELRSRVIALTLRLGWLYLRMRAHPKELTEVKTTLSDLWANFRTLRNATIEGRGAWWKWKLTSGMARLKVRRLKRKTSRRIAMARDPNALPQRLRRVASRLATKSARWTMAVLVIAMGVAFYQVLTGTAEIVGRADHSIAASDEPALSRFIVSGLRPTKYVVEFLDDSHIPATIRSLAGGHGAGPDMLLLGISSDEYVLFSPVVDRVYFIAADQMVLSSSE